VYGDLEKLLEFLLCLTIPFSTIHRSAAKELALYMGINALPLLFMHVAL